MADVNVVISEYSPKQIKGQYLVGIVFKNLSTFIFFH